MKAIVLPSGAVVAVSTHAHVVEQGIYMDGSIYADPNLSLVEVNETPRPYRDKIVAGKIIPNENYHNPVDERVAALEESLAEKDAIIDALLIDVLMGGDADV